MKVSGNLNIETGIWFHKKVGIGIGIGIGYKSGIGTALILTVVVYPQSNRSLVRVLLKISVYLNILFIKTVTPSLLGCC